MLVAASDGVAPAPGLIARAQAAGAVPVASRLAVYEEVLGDGEAGLLFEPNDLETLTAQLGRLVADGDLRERLRAAARPRPWSAVADELEALYRTLAARRHDVRGNADDRARRCRAGARSTSTCTCTPTTATTAPRRSRCCWPPRAPRAWARSR